MLNGTFVQFPTLVLCKATPHPPYLIVQTVSFDIFTYSAGNLDQDITPFLAVSYLLTL